jgi:hypothetical protein
MLSRTWLEEKCSSCRDHDHDFFFTTFILDSSMAMIFLKTRDFIGLRVMGGEWESLRIFLVVSLRRRSMATIEQGLLDDPSRFIHSPVFCVSYLFSHHRIHRFPFVCGRHPLRFRPIMHHLFGCRLPP